ncbi:MAG: hypothetical protein IJ911_12920 [Salinivirgaceae bacterium]|nr:hypothetical protein [Salinivirgaceae bacterium]
MKNVITKIIGMLFVIALFTECKDPRSAEEISKLYDGIFLLEKGYRERENSLHYIIFYQDSTYIHKYIVGGDTLINKGKWRLTNYFNFYLYDWIPYGKDPFPLKDGEKCQDRFPSILLHKNDDYAGLRFQIDLGYDFKKISKQNADRLGIKEDSVTWHRIQEYSWERIEREIEEEKMNNGQKRAKQYENK